MTIDISEFKSKSLRLLDEIQHSGESITVNKWEVSIAKVVPLHNQDHCINPSSMLA